MEWAPQKWINKLGATWLFQHGLSGPSTPLLIPPGWYLWTWVGGTQATWGALNFPSEVTEVQGLVTLFGHETIPNINAKYKHFLELELSSIQNITMNIFFPICDPDGPQWQRNLDLLSANRAPCCDHTVCTSRLINLRSNMLIAFRRHIGWTAQAQHWLRM